MVLISILPIQAKIVKQATYIYGFATSFNDSTVYLAEIQLVDGAWVDTKTGFLYGRDSYSYQMRDWLKGKGFKAPTCVTGFANTRKKAEEKYLKLRNKYLAKGRYDIKYLGVSDFRYNAVEFDEEKVYVDSATSKVVKTKKQKKTNDEHNR